MRQTLLWSALYAVFALLTVQTPVVEADIWWHLRTGQWIIEHGTVPVTDPFTYTCWGQPWMAYSWLFELVAYAVYQQAGLVGILGLRVAEVLAVVAAAHRLVARREPSVPRAITPSSRNARGCSPSSATS